MYSLNLGLTNRCNAKCVFCPTRETTQKLIDMPFGLACNIIDETVPYIKHHISLALFGESTLYKKLPEIVEYVRRKSKLQIILYTNGIILPKVDVDIIVSLDATSRQEYIFTKGVDKYDQVIENIKKLQCTVQYAKLVYKNEPVSYGKKMKLGRIISWNGNIDVSTVKRKPLPCGHIFEYMNIASNGDMVLCCLDYNHDFNLGNVRDGVMKVWHGERFNKIRRNQINGIFPKMCKKCENEYYYNAL